jgi:hypothetical protein
MSSEVGHQTLSQLHGRNLSLTLGQIINVADPDNLNRVQVLLASEGGKSASPWYYRMVPISRLAIPIDLVGKTAVCGYLDGDPHEGVVLGILVNELTRMNQSQEQLLYQLGASMVSIKDKEIKLSTGNIDFVITDSDIQINGKSVLTIGSKDSHNDTSTLKGWNIK